MGESFLNDRVMLRPGNCLDVLARLEECSIDSCVTDPPYHLTEITIPRVKFGLARTEADKAVRRGFMGKTWDGGSVAFDPATWREVYRVLKPGGHLLAMGGTRTFHRLACAIEDAGFDIRDTISWLYGSGFPKSHDVSKGIDRAAGAERDVVGRRPDWVVSDKWREAEGREDRPESILDITAPATDAARQWEGWGTALKPAMELCVLARKPLSEGTVAANVLRWGTGAINVGGCRITIEDKGGWRPNCVGKDYGDGNVFGKGLGLISAQNPLGRWPANVAHDGSDEVTAAFPESDGAQGDVRGTEPSETGQNGIYGRFARVAGPPLRNDTGSAARFFYTAKADADDRLGSKHPTVKPLDLMQWLVRLVTPRGGVVLDPFAGTGTTGEAAWREGMRAVLIEAEAEYQADIRRRMALVLAGPDERTRESIKAKGLPVDYGPLFGFPEAAE